MRKRGIYWECMFCNIAGFFRWGLNMHMHQHDREVVREAEAIQRGLCLTCHLLTNVHIPHKPCFKIHCYCGCHRGVDTRPLS